MLNGRLFLKNDVDDSLPIAIIDIDMERELFSTNGSAIGKYIYISSIPFKIIGVAKLPGIKITIINLNYGCRIVLIFLE